MTGVAAGTAGREGATGRAEAGAAGAVVEVEEAGTAKETVEVEVEGAGTEGVAVEGTVGWEDDVEGWTGTALRFPLDFFEKIGLHSGWLKL